MEETNLFKAIAEVAMTGDEVKADITKAVTEYRGLIQQRQDMAQVRTDVASAIIELEGMVSKTGIVELDKAEKARKLIMRELHKFGEILVAQDHYKKLYDPENNPFEEIEYIIGYGDGGGGNYKYEWAFTTKLKEVTQKQKENGMLDELVGRDSSKEIKVGVKNVITNLKEQIKDLDRLEKMEATNIMANEHYKAYKTQLAQGLAGRGKKTIIDIERMEIGGQTGEAFWDHMFIHERENFEMMREILSDRQEISETSKSTYNNLQKVQSSRHDWLETTGEDTKIVWEHLLMARGHLQGLVFGDVGRSQIKNSKGTEVRVQKIQTILDALRWYEKIINNFITPGQLAQKIFKESNQLFHEQAIYKGNDFDDKIKKSLLAEINKDINKSGIKSKFI